MHSLITFLGGGIVFLAGTYVGRAIRKSIDWDEGYKCAKEIYKTRLNEAYGAIAFPAPAPFQARMPEGARRSMCIECGYTFATHAATCSKRFGIDG